MDDQATGHWGGLACGGLRFRIGFAALCGLLALIGAFLLQPPRALAVEHKPFIPPVSDPIPKGTRVKVVADKITVDQDSKIATATGTVRLIYGPYQLDATKVVYNQATGEFDANGSIVVREPNGNVLLADSIDLKNKFRDGFAVHVKALLNNDGTITADYVRRIDGHISVFEHATYSACKTCRTRSGHPVWEIDADQTTHDAKTHNLYHVNPSFKINGATVLKLPYLAMADPSVTRRSGFLFPDVKASSDFGVGLVTPYFWAISPSTDLTFRPVWTTSQGPIADVEWRQALENGQYNIRAIGVHQFTHLDPPEDGEWRGAIDTHGKFTSGEDWTYGWDGTFATDQTFLDKYGYDGRRYAVNDLYATRISDQNYVSAQLLNFQSLNTAIDPDTMPYAMPFITGESIMRDTPIGGQFDFSWNAYSVHRAVAYTIPLTDINLGTDQTRATAQLNWHNQFYSDVGTVITPFVNMRSDVLTADNVPDTTSPTGYTSDTFTRVLPQVGLDARFPFIANLPFGQSIISPVFQIVSSANEGDTSAFGNEDSITLNYDHTSLFLADRFTGLDRYEGGTHADVGVTYSLIGRNGGFIRASAGQSIHLAGQDSFTDGSGLADNESDLVAAVVLQPFDWFSLSYEARLKDDFSDFNRQEAVASLSFDRFSANLSYLDFAPEPDYGLPYEQHWISFDGKIGISNGWSAFAGMTYDYTTSILTRRVAGVEYDCQCMNFKMYYLGTEDSVTHETDDSVMMSVEFATLGSTGASVGF